MTSVLILIVTLIWFAASAYVFRQINYSQPIRLALLSALCLALILMKLLT